jgi:hypothetical protein
MMATPKKPNGIPIETFICIEGFDRNFKALMNERPEFTQTGVKNALVDAVLSVKNTGSEHKANQKQKASKPRPKKSVDGTTINELITQLKRAYPNEKPSSVWIHLKSKIDEWADCHCILTRPNPAKTDSWFYSFTIGETQQQITYATFRKSMAKK